MAIFAALAGFRVDVDFGQAVNQVLGQEGEKLGQGPVDRQAPTPSAEIGVRVPFEDCGGDGFLLETLGEHEAGDASADYEDVRLRLLWGGNCCGCHFGRSILFLVLSCRLSSSPSFHLNLYSV